MHAVGCRPDVITVNEAYAFSTVLIDFPFSAGLLHSPYDLLQPPLAKNVVNVCK